MPAAAPGASHAAGLPSYLIMQPSYWHLWTFGSITKVCMHGCYKHVPTAGSKEYLEALEDKRAIKVSILTFTLHACGMHTDDHVFTREDVLVQISGSSTFIGLAILVCAGISYGVFSPAFNLASNDQVPPLVRYLSAWKKIFSASVSCRRRVDCNRLQLHKFVRIDRLAGLDFHRTTSAICSRARGQLCSELCSDGNMLLVAVAQA